MLATTLFRTFLNTKEKKVEHDVITKLVACANLRGSLLAHQVEGVAWMLRRESFAWDRYFSKQRRMKN
jgi:hypothetical protein